MNKIVMRNERWEDYRKVEELHKKAFWNVYVPGCSEHYLAHILRDHSDFIPELDYVCEVNGRIIANVMYTKSKLTDEQGNYKEILTFGPISVSPEFQRKGIGKALLKKTFDESVKLGYKAIIIFGSPGNYVGSGFKSCKKYNVCLEDGIFPTALLVKELDSGFFDGRKYFFHESPAFEIDENAVNEFDKDFEPMEKAFQPSQDEFYILSNSVIR